MKKIFVVATAFSLLLYSCSGEEKLEEPEAVQFEDSDTEETADTTAMRHIDYNIPGPSDQFAILARLDGTKNNGALLPADSVNTYATVSGKSLAFGVYTADLAYLTAYRENVKSINYFGTLENLSEDLGVSAIFGEELKKAMEKNRGNTDSLFRLADMTYMNSMNRMISNDKGNELALMLIGGWFESMYLTLNTSKGFDKSPRINKYLAGQKLVAENLMALLLDYQDNEDVVRFTEKLSEIMAVFDQMECDYSATDVASEGGKKVLKGGASCTLTKEIYEELSTRITQYRSEIIALK